MNWALAIEKNREALKRVLAMLVSMVQAEKSNPSPALPRHLHRFVLRLLRPAEAAARRLIIIAARGLVVELAPPRLRAGKPKPALNRSNGFGTGVVIRPGPLPEWARALAPKRSSTLSLPLLDPLKRFGVRRYVKPSAMPRIRSFDDPRIGFFQPPRDPVPLPPSPDDPLDASRLCRRLEAIASALDDLPRQAKRLARWQARLDVREREGRGGDLLQPTPALRADLPGRATGLARPPDPHRGEGGAAGAQTRGRLQRLSPMRPGRPPGWRRRPDHGVYEVLNEIHSLAVCVRDAPDTS